MVSSSLTAQGAAAAAARQQQQQMQQRSLAPKFDAAAGSSLSPPGASSSPEAAAVCALEHALTRSGSAAAIKAATKDFLSTRCVLSSPMGRVVGRDAVARFFRLWQVLLVDDCTVEAVAVGDALGAASGRYGGGGGAGAAGGLFGPAAPPLQGASFEQQQQQQPLLQPRPRRVALARLTHRVHPRFLDALAHHPAHVAHAALPSWEGAGSGEGAASFEVPPHAHRAVTPSSPRASFPSAVSSSSPVPALLAYSFSWLRARLTFTLVDNVVYVFEREGEGEGALGGSGGAGGGGGGGMAGGGSTSAGASGGGLVGGAPPKISSIRAEIALVSLAYALPFGALAWHGAVEPALGAAAQVADAAWGAWLRPLALPWARSALGYAGLDLL